MSPKSASPVDRWAAFRGLAWWQLVLTFVPLILIGLGGLIGGAIGGGAAWINLKLARQPWNPAAKAAAMIGVAGAAFGVYFLTVGAIRAALGL